MSERARLTPFAYGFRPFFLAALAYALIAIVAWIAIRETGSTPLPEMPPHLWHGHEMLFGFVVAAVAGFLLTAVPSWTGSRAVAGTPLILLTAIWLAGRLAFGFSAYVPIRVVAAIELAFLPVLAAIIAVPLVRARSRNLVVLLVLLALWFADGTFLCALALRDASLASDTLRVTLDIILVLITIIGGRIVPAFTANALRKRNVDATVRNMGWLTGVAIGSMVLVAAIDWYAPRHPVAVWAAALASIANVVRLSGWGGTRSLKEPIVWVLHLAYLWIPVGLALKAIYLATGANWASAWFHMLGMGAASLMIVAVITRAALGHTGRPLVVSRSVAVAYGVLTLAVFSRALVPVFGDWSEWGLRLTALIWSIGFGIVLWNYTPILLRARFDERAAAKG